MHFSWVLPGPHALGGIDHSDTRGRCIRESIRECHSQFFGRNPLWLSIVLSLAIAGAGGGGGAGGAGILQSTHKNTVNLSFVTFYQAAKML